MQQKLVAPPPPDKPPFFSRLFTRILAYFGPNSLGVRNWLLIASFGYLALFSIFFIAPPLAPALFLGLIIGFCTLLGMGLVCALGLGVIACYREYQVYKKSSDKNKSSYFAYLLEKFGDWALENPYTTKLTGCLLVGVLALLVSMPFTAAPLMVAVAIGVFFAVMPIIEAIGRLIGVAFDGFSVIDQGEDVSRTPWQPQIREMSSDGKTILVQTSDIINRSNQTQTLVSADRNPIVTLMQQQFGAHFVVCECATLRVSKQTKLGKPAEFSYVDERQSVDIKNGQVVVDTKESEFIRSCMRELFGESFSVGQNAELYYTRVLTGDRKLLKFSYKDAQQSFTMENGQIRRTTVELSDDDAAADKKSDDSSDNDADEQSEDSLVKLNAYTRRH